MGDTQSEGKDRLGFSGYGYSSSLAPSSFASVSKPSQPHSPTFAKQTTDPTPTAAANSDGPSSISGGNSNSNDNPDNHPPLAAVAIPILLLLAALAALIFFLWRRKRTRRQRAQQTQPFAPEMAYRGPDSTAYQPQSEFSLPSFSSAAATAPIILSSRTNNAYLTGLDTSSQGSNSNRNSRDLTDAADRRSLGGTTFLEPPPPYQREDDEDEPLPSAGGGNGYGAVPTEEVQRARSPFEDPEYELPPPGPAGFAALRGSRRGPFDDPGSPVSEMGSRTVLTRRMSDVSDL